MTHVLTCVHLALLAFLLAAQICHGQNTYDTFDELIDGLTTGHIATVNIDSDKCLNSLPPDSAKWNINVAMRHWWIENRDYYLDQAERVLRVNDYFKGSEPDLWVVREILVRPDGRVEAEATWYYDNGTNPTGNYPQSCELGEGAVFHRMTGELDETILVTSYEMLKSELLFGRHVVGVVDLHKCSSSLGSDLYAYTFGINVWSFLVVDEGSMEESIRMYTNFVDDNPTGAGNPFAFNSFGIRIDREDPSTAIVSHGAFEFSNGTNVSQFPYTSYTCSGNAVRFYSRRYERDGVYNTYDDLKKALTEGHQVEVVNFAKYCTGTSNPPEEIGNNIRGQMFDAWSLHPSGTKDGPGEVIAFFNDVISPAGYYSVEEALVFPDQSIHINSLTTDITSSMDTVFQGSEHCYLGGSTVFHANLADKSAVTTYDSVRSRFMSNGAIFEAKVNMTKCSVPDGAHLDVHTFIMWESFLRTDDEGGFEGVSFNLAENIVNATNTIEDTAWVVRSLWLRPSGMADVKVASFAAQTYEELENVAFTCGLNEGLELYQYYF